MKTQKRDSHGRFVKNIENNNAKIFGNYFGGAWEDEEGDYIQKYFLVLSDDNFYFYYPEIDKKTNFGVWNLEDVKHRVEKGNWKELPYSLLEKEFSNQIAKIDEILGLSNEEVLQKQIENSKQNQKLSIDDIKIGSLYYNFGECLVMRVVEVIGRLIYVSYHKGYATPYGISSFRKATKEEVDEYLEESKDLEEEYK